LVPRNIWFNNPGQTQASSYLTGTAGPRNPTATRTLNEGPRDPLSLHLEGDADIRVTADGPRHRSNPVTIRETRGTHSLMIHMSQALGVNCAYCHNTRAFNAWDQSRPQRTTAWYGIRMVRDLNNAYLAPLVSVLPKHRLGEAMADAPKVNCATCHNGVFKPLLGQSMMETFPELREPPVDALAERSAAALTPPD
jgi:photosynthetic reaction center cytochrome c subunit